MKSVTALSSGVLGFFSRKLYSKSHDSTSISIYFIGKYVDTLSENKSISCSLNQPNVEIRITNSKGVI